jgi:tetratricopeptide (TPR) repeat protein
VANIKTIAVPPPTDLPEEHTNDLPGIPGYKILAVLGRGGMGVVYKARQLSLNRVVALKMVLAGAHADPRLLARLHLEAEALADLQHPHIVQVYEVGEHDHCPYLALEFVDGGTLARKLAGHPQPPRAAAVLMETLAGAVHCAHLRGIVHRDLKPLNILLTRDGVLKITDFGLAKRLEAQGQTHTGDVMGTPSYMAPEQAAGRIREVGPLSDVYALGAILYEMLTGRPPFGGPTVLKIIAQVVSAEPVAPGRLHDKVPRDLETICLKCLEKDPKKRYANALDLAEDLHRYLAGEPIRARPVSTAERAVKWVKRRPALAFMGLLSVLAALGLAAGGVWHTVRLRAERDRAERNFEQARRAVDEMLTEVAQEQLAFEPLMEKKRRALLEKALGFYQEFLQERGSDTTLRRATALANKRVADISRILRLDERAVEAYDQAIALLTGLASENPGEPALRQSLAESHNYRGEVFRMADRLRQAREAYEEALRLQRELAAQFPDEPAYRRDLARTLYNLGILSRSTNQPQEAKEHLAEAIALLKDLAKTSPDVPEFRQHLARSYLNLGPVLRATDGFDKAADTYQKAIALLGELHRQYPYVPDYQHELAVTHNNRGILLAGAGRFAEARDAHQVALDLFGKLVANFPSVPDYRKELANTHDGLGIVRTHEGAWFDAERHFELARELFGKLLEEVPDVADYRVHLGKTLGNQAWLRTKQEDWGAARPLLEEAVERLKAALDINPDNRFCRQALRAQYQSLAETLVRLKDHRNAAKAAEALPGVFGDQALDYYFAACFLSRCVPLAESDALPKAAARYADKAVGMLGEVVRRDCKKIQRLPNESEIFRPLQKREDFKRLLAELDVRTARVQKAAP